jgi:small subunit ribosomal protein S9
VSPEERDDAAHEPETVPGEPGEATPEPGESPEPEAPEPEQPDAEPAPEPVAEAADEPGAEAEGPAAEPEPAAEAEPAEAPERERRKPARDERRSEEELVPGAHLEPDLVLEEEQRPEGEYSEFVEAEVEVSEEDAAEEEGADEAVAAPVRREPLDLAADARYAATGKRKSAVARVILRPGEGTYTINKRHLDEYFPRVRLQRMARQPLEAAGYQNRMDVVARIHGGGVSAQATALRHGVARALVEADPALRGELKRRGYLTRDPRVKERKKAGLKKARKRPQFSKR